jgi:prolipoprotein diacylglyceryltransferase
MIPPAIFYLWGINRTQKRSALFQLLKLTMPAAFITEGLGRFLNFRNRGVLRIRAEADLTAGYAELMGLKLIVRVFQKKVLAATDWTLHLLSPLINFPPSAENFR